MGTRIFFTIKTHFDCVNTSHVKEFLYCNMIRIVTSFWYFVYSHMFSVFGVVFRHVFRFAVCKNSEKNEMNSSKVYNQQDERQIGSSCSQDSDVNKSNGETDNSVVMKTASSASSANKYEFLSGKGISGFIEEPKTLSFTIHEVYEGSFCKTPILHVGENSAFKDFQELPDSKVEAFIEDRAEEAECSHIEECWQKQKQEKFTNRKVSEEEHVIIDDGGSTDYDFEKNELHDEACVEEKEEDSVKSLVIEEVLEEKEAEIRTHEKGFEQEEVVRLEDRLEDEHEHESSYEVKLPSTLPSDVEQETICSNDEFSGSEGKIDSITYEFFAYRNKGLGHESPVFIDEEKVGHNREIETLFLSDFSSDSDDEYIELEPQMHNSISLDENILSKEDSSMVDEKQAQDDLVHEAVLKTDGLDDLSKGNHKHEEQELVHEEAEPITDGSKTPEQSSLLKKNSSNYEVQDDTELTFEHEDIIEQLKLELKLARTGGLPTILEESETEELETPKVVQELKPLKIEEKSEKKDCMSEIQKVYKSYADRMRKLDILNFQTMHAAGLLQLKDTVHSQTPRKSSAIAIKALFSHPLWSCKEGIPAVDPMKKIIADVHKDFEAVYVGQLCLSWEILHWQYRKLQELQNFDSQGYHQYNQVAGEFQLCQVLLERFIENEPFQGPRIQNYVKNRCVVRNLLQVPVIKDDSLKDKGKVGEDEHVSTTTQMLLEIIEESMQIFWEFLRADKDEINVNQQAYTNFLGFVDAELLMDILNDFQKKEKKLKDILRSGNCIIKRFKKHQENQRHRTLFVAQFELKLISRVLNMTKITTDQLIWCHEKLEKIKFSNRKVLLEPSFLLFPC